MFAAPRRELALRFASVRSSPTGNGVAVMKKWQLSVALVLCFGVMLVLRTLKRGISAWVPSILRCR